jgi:hypothetical protein
MTPTRASRVTLAGAALDGEAEGHVGPGRLAVGDADERR